MNTANKIPALGATMRKTGGEILYRVIERSERGVRVEATVTEVVPSQTYGTRQPRKLTYTERFASLAYSEATGRPSFVDGRWNAWEVVA